MPQISIEQMRNYLGRSISSFNQNKLNGILAEIDFRNYISYIGSAEKVSVGGWIFRSEGSGNFGHHTVVLFPENILPDQEYENERVLTQPSHGLHTICSTFHQIGIHSFYCSFRLSENNGTVCPVWNWVQLGLPVEQPYHLAFDGLSGFNPRERRYNFLRHHTNADNIPDEFISEQYTKENIRIAFQEQYMSEVSDVDGILWGNQYTYPIEIKEKTVADDRRIGNYFGIDVGPFVKLAYYAAKKGNLHSLFVVREIDNTTDRNLVNWWYITFDRLAQFASWVGIGGGRNMAGGSSNVVKIPYSEFQVLNAGSIEEL